MEEVSNSTVSISNSSSGAQLLLSQKAFVQAQTPKRVNSSKNKNRLPAAAAAAAPQQQQQQQLLLSQQQQQQPSLPSSANNSTHEPLRRSISHSYGVNASPTLSAASTSNSNHGGGVGTGTTTSSTVSGSAAHTPPQTQTLSSVSAINNNNKRLYRAGENKWVTRDIASLDFLLGIPLAAEKEIVTTGWQLQLQRDNDDDSSHSAADNYAYRQVASVARTAMEDVPATAQGTWWEKWVQHEHMKQGGIHKKKTKNNDTEAAELEQPTEADTSAARVTNGSNNSNNKNHPSFVPLSYAPGRRLEGDQAVRIQIPLTVDTVTKQRSIARQAALREWELQTAHGLADTPPMLDGRLFFSANSSYPVSVFSIIRYEPSESPSVDILLLLLHVYGGMSAK